MGSRFSLAACFASIVLMGSLMFVTCKKEVLLPVSGLITDPNQAIAVDGVKVEIWTQQIEGGIFTANFTLAGTMITGPDGKFLFNIEKRNYTGIRLIFSKDGYYGWQADVNIEKINKEQSHYAEYQLLPQAWLDIRVKNASPFNSDDYFEFRILNGYTSCEDCCKGEKYQFTGINVDQVINCQTSGHQDILIQWSVRKNGEQIYKTDHYFIEAFETTAIDLTY